jgi:hypothetical protein
MNIKYFIGPMSKNVVDAIIEYTKETENKIGLIPSRRQVSYDGGYVNNWTTNNFSEYAKDLFLTRDHGGPGQGLLDDDGYKSLEVDCQNLDMIHIDPWKKYPRYEDGLIWTVQMIKFCYCRNADIFFEVGTEESIRKFSSEELDRLLQDLKDNLDEQEFKQIKYCVIQSGTSLKENNNTGLYNKQRLKSMISVVKKHNLLSKEHNGDYLPINLIREKFLLGLDSINIAPEFGQIETKTYLQEIKKERPNLLNLMWKISYDSKKWKKWVDNTFNPEEKKEELINICGHYVLSNEIFQSEIKSNFSNIDEKIKNNIKNKLKELFDGQ